MNSQELATFLASGTKIAEGEANWGGNLPLRITCCLSELPPPLEYVSSVRAIVFKDDLVLVVTDRPQHYNIIPGGRHEEGESPLDTLRRELIEEAGWTVKNMRLLGFLHMHHLGPKPAGYKYMYPDFLQSIYMCEADSYTPQAKLKDDYVLHSEFHTIAETLALDIEELELLKAALVLRKKSL